jgi:hypothetical protein
MHLLHFIPHVIGFKDRQLCLLFGEPISPGIIGGEMQQTQAVSASRRGACSRRGTLIHAQVGVRIRQFERAFDPCPDECTGFFRSLGQ